MTASTMAPTQRAVVRPALRGAIHRSSVPVAVCLVVLLAVRAPTAGTRAAVTFYGVCVVAMLTISGVYHLPSLFTRDRRVLKRLDHSAILLATAGTYTAVIVLATDGTARVVMLALVWAVTAAGVAIRMAWLDGPPGAVGGVYIVAGWMAVGYLPVLVRTLNGVEIGLLFAGGALYTVGAAIFAARRPDPWPTTFGYHEIFHAFVVAAAFCHWVTIYSLAG